MYLFAILRGSNDSAPAARAPFRRVAVQAPCFAHSATTYEEEANYFGIDHFSDRLRGQTSPWDLRYIDREMRSGTEEIIDLFAFALDLKEPDQLELPLLPKACERPILKCGGISGFTARLDGATRGLLRHLRDIPDLVFAGGAVIGCLTNQPFGDVDIFLTGSLQEAESRLRSIFEAVKTAAKTFDEKPRFLVLRIGETG